MVYVKKQYDRKCIMCGVDFTASQPKSKLCSPTCRRKRNQRETGRFSRDGLPSGTVGAISELVISNDLLKKGYAVFRSLSQSCFCDIIAIRESTLKIEIKTGYYNKTTKTVGYPKTHHEGVDLYGIYERNNDQVFYFTMDGKEVEL